MSTKKTAPSAPTLLDLAEAYVKHLEKAGKSSGTQFSYAMDLKLALAELGEKTKLSTLTAAKVAAFFECERTTTTRSGLPKADVTVRKTQRVLRFALEFAVAEGWLETAPLPEPAND